MVWIGLYYRDRTREAVAYVLQWRVTKLITILFGRPDSKGFWGRVYYDGWNNFIMVELELYCSDWLESLQQDLKLILDEHENCVITTN